mmetsp:Transcript_8467/g.35878  ORF Transcript_8467/g.35878 Transcript_8467/m.35878 type:complete len:214 (+) Transcript_8467:335-976(+)
MIGRPTSPIVSDVSAIFIIAGPRPRSRRTLQRLARDHAHLRSRRRRHAPRALLRDARVRFRRKGRPAGLGPHVRFRGAGFRQERLREVPRPVVRPLQVHGPRLEQARRELRGLVVRSDRGRGLHRGRRAHLPAHGRPRVPHHQVLHVRGQEGQGLPAGPRLQLAQAVRGPHAQQAHVRRRLEEGLREERGGVHREARGQVRGRDQGCLRGEGG